MHTVNTNAIIRLLVLLGGLVMTLAILYLVLESKSTGAVAALIFVVGAVGAITAVINPRFGLAIVIVEGVFLDFFKKVAVTYGEPTLLTVIQVLVVSLLTLSCVYLGIFLRMLLKVIPVRASDIILFGACAGAMGFFYIAEASGGLGRMQSATNGGLFVGLLPSIAILLKTKEDVCKLLKLLFWCIVPFGGWAIYQYIFGFTDMEWAYAYTWLSPVSSNHMLSNEHPRVFGLASGPSGFGAIVFFPIIGLYFASTVKNGKIWYLLGVAIIIISLLCAEQRTPLLLPFICAAFYLFLFNGRRVLIAYCLAFTLLGAGILSSKFLLDNLENWTYQLRLAAGANPGDLNDWRNRVIVVNSFSDRLIGWQRFLEPKNYSLLGRLGGSGTYVTEGLGQENFAGDEYSHDVINKVLIQSGVVGLIIFFVISITFLVLIHRQHLMIADNGIRTLATLLAASVMPALVIQTMAGLTLTTNPINLVVWTLCGCLYALNQIDQADQKQKAISTATSASLSSTADRPLRPA